MKTHLFRPGEKITMCGIEIKSFSTSDPTKITCKRCIGFYVGNKDWYSLLLNEDSV